MKFVIKNTQSKAEKEGDVLVRYSGVSEPFSRHSERDVRVLDVDEKQNPIKWKFTTGLDEKQVPYYKWYSDEDKAELIKSIKTLRKTIEDYYGGADAVSPNNFYFWKKNVEVAKLSLTHADVDIFFDTDKPLHALLYLSIAAGAFMDLVAPTREWAERHQILHYMALEKEANDFQDEEDIKRSEAHAALGELRKDYGRDALYILAWCIQYETATFAAYSNSTPDKDLINYHIMFIDGKINTKRKRNCPRIFVEYAEKWKGQKTRELLYVEAYVKAGEYYNYVSQRDKKYVTSDGTILGNTVTEAVDNLVDPKFSVDFQKLRKQVEDKWNE